jgi:outer membrane protein OmpA-like peptidoglycan-associated protein
MFANTKKLGLLATAMLITAAASPVTAWHNGTHDSVMDVRGNFVKDARGNCVVTKWEDGMYVCGQQVLHEDKRNIYFDFDSASLTTMARQKLNYIAEMADASSKPVTVEIVGHADKMGSAVYNQALSKKRAKAVKHYLMGKGLDKFRVTRMEAQGESDPVTQNCAEGDIKCLQADRRVEIKFHYE